MARAASWTTRSVNGCCLPGMDILVLERLRTPLLVSVPVLKERNFSKVVVDDCVHVDAETHVFIVPETTEQQQINITKLIQFERYTPHPNRDR